MRSLSGVVLLAAFAAGGEAEYARYLANAPEFRPVARIEARWETWIYMPWRYAWTIGTGEKGGLFCLEHGINGGFTDHGDGPIAWLEEYGLRFYNDHTAGKGILFLRGAQDRGRFRELQTDALAVRAPPLDEETFGTARDLVRRNLARVRQSPMRLAYALDDEISWGAFVLPLPWRVHDDDAAYSAWLEGLHGERRETRYVTPEETRRQLYRPLAEIDFSPLLDRLSYNDSVLANFVGRLVEEANRIDPATPCGFVGGQMPSAWGGYDWAKLARKAQFLEVYDTGSAPEIVRSFTADREVPLVSTHFHADGESDAWKAWVRFAHGQRGMIGWVEGWFDGETPRPWLAAFGPTLKELARVQGPKMAGARWVHDGIAICYSHPSIQVSWCLDSEAHGKTWMNRGNDDRLGTSHLVRRAWEHMLNDAGLQYDFVAYDVVAREGVPAAYDVLILPACFALSDLEARRIREFVERGGHVVADFMCGLFDEHGRGRAKGALDDLFGVTHDGTETRADFFAKKLWVETDQDAGYDHRTWRALFETLDCPLRDGFAVPERRLPGGRVGERTAYLNLSPQRYLQMREEGEAGPGARRLFLATLPVTPRVEARGPRDLEITRFRRGDRTLLFVFANPGRSGRADVEVLFREPVRDLVDERLRRNLGEGRSFRFELDLEEALFLSFLR